MRRFTVYFLPAIAVAAVVFGLFYAWTAFQTCRRGEIGVGVFLLVFGLGGVALGIAMWTTWRNIVRQAREARRAVGPSDSPTV